MSILNFDYVKKLSEEESDISGQLQRLYYLTAGIRKKDKIVVELGMRYGTSTKALLAAVNDSGGHLHSVDIVQLAQINDESNFTFILSDDMELVKTWNKKIDHLFIDTSHTYEHTLGELQQWGAWVVEGGVISLHDTNQEPVMNAIKKYIEQTGYSFNNFEESNGLGVIIKGQQNA